ncbi:hypothetical protein [Olsenella sp. HMSC062G07]|uniref:hypothetical protein n=1 Tax=Olsenella sp. HMSC062G07 TaxID=1739330 RepID=UPI0008A3F912|nr:hypothetical protein [Olsenella sp. HMSC062G07]OFK24994.1 hypothetical protein HMPREF2826_03435 [Olsenella sp. HMSC062G07]
MDPEKNDKPDKGAEAFAGGDMDVTDTHADGPIFDLPGYVRQEVVCDRHNREHLLLTTGQGGARLMPYLDESGKRKVMPQT